MAVENSAHFVPVPGALCTLCLSCHLGCPAVFSLLKCPPYHEINLFLHMVQPNKTAYPAP